jgi:20S proteasome alpha/beta subunit
MTAIVGVLCRDGVVIGSDSASTSTTRSGPMGFKTIETPSKKISIIDDQIIVSGSGEVGLHQRFCYIVDALSKQNRFSADPIEVATQIAQSTLQQFAQTYIQKGNIDYGALVAFPSGAEFKLCEFAIGSLEPEFKSNDRWFASMGSGQPLTDPFLGFLRKIFWPSSNQNAPSTKEGIFFTVWTLLHAIDVNPGGINDPIQLAVLANNGSGARARILEYSETAEHTASVEAAEEHLRDYSRKLSGQVQSDAPSVPNLE